MSGDVWTRYIFRCDTCGRATNWVRTAEMHEMKNAGHEMLEFDPTPATPAAVETTGGEG